MITCGNCGAQIQEGATVCPSCGAIVGGGYQTAPQSPDLDAQNNKAMGVLAYLGLLVLIPIFVAKDSPFARYHSNQGLVLCIIGIGCSIVFRILSYIPIVNILAGILSFIVGILVLVLMIIGIVNAVKGEMKPLPLTGGITLLK